MTRFLVAFVAAALTLTAAASARPRARPDLVEGALGKVPAQLAPGDSFTVSDVARNRGAAQAHTSVTEFRLARGTISLPVGRRRIPGLKAHRSARASVRLAVPAEAPVGVYTLVACADVNRGVREANERNNCRAATGRVEVRRPDTTPPPTPPPTPGPTDSDHDGSPNDADCAPNDAAIHPGAADRPDIGFVDSNCDGIDGDADESIFVSPAGDDAAPGTKAHPKRTVGAGVLAAASGRRAVLVAVGSYDEGQGVNLEDGVGVYGGFNPSSWSRSASTGTVIRGAPQAVLADGDTDVTLQLLTLLGSPVPAEGESAYAVREINKSQLTIERSTLQSADGRAGRTGEAGLDGVRGGDGVPGQRGNPDGPNGHGGRGGFGLLAGGDAGDGGRPGDNDGNAGAPGSGPRAGAPGDGGSGGDPGRDGTDGAPGGDGTSAGAPGQGGPSGIDLAKTTWVGHDGTAGGTGDGGSGGGGGGGGGGQGCFFCFDGGGSGGGGGGAGGSGGHGGGSGRAGGGSFGIYLLDSTVALSSGTSIGVGAGGAGGAGGAAGKGGFGGLGAGGGFLDGDEIGDGGSGGQGGSGADGGTGGGGAGGPSIGILRLGDSRLTVGSDVTITPGSAGRGGSGGSVGQDGIAVALFPATA